MTAAPMKCLVLAAAATLAGACGSGDPGDPPSDAPADTSSGDLGGDATDEDTGATDSAGGEDASDSDLDAGEEGSGASTDLEDAPTDLEDAPADPGDVAPDLPPVACTPVEPPGPDPIASDQRRFALTMFHYNVEYVIGGLEYTDPDTGENRTILGLPIAIGWTNDRVEDYIIEETMRPILEMYAAHPSWRFDIEMQAYALEVMAARHPETLALLRTLAQAGQAEVVSFHYAAQLFLAFPREDQERSVARTRAVFEQHCVPLSGVVFNQEGQAGEGRQQLLVETGYRIGVFPKNLWRYVRPETPWPVYASEGGRLIVGPGGVDPDSGIEVTWPFFDDGELRAVSEVSNPYTAPISPHVPARVAEYEAELQALEDAGWKITSISDYVHQVEGMGVDVQPAPPVLDGTWQPPSTDSIHRWLGGRSQVNVGDEEDNRVRSGNATARMHTDATQVLLEEAGRAGVTSEAWETEMARIWEDLWHAQVSDASGVNPWRGEVLWCLGLNDRVQERTAAIREAVLGALGWPHARVDLSERSATRLEDIPLPEPPDTTAPWFDVTVTAPGRTTTTEWFATGSEDRAQIQVRFSAASACDGCDNRRLEVAFPWDQSTLAYSPGLLDDQVRTYAMADFTFLEDQAFLPLANGLIRLSDDLWLIKHTRAGHIAARISPSDDHVRFIDAAIYRATAPAWVFEVVRGSEDVALEAARAINVDPVVTY